MSRKLEIASTLTLALLLAAGTTMAQKSQDLVLDPNNQQLVILSAIVDLDDPPQIRIEGFNFKPGKGSPSGKSGKSDKSGKGSKQLVPRVFMGLPGGL